MKRFLRMYSIEQKMFFRSPDVILFCLIMPLAVFSTLLLTAAAVLMGYRMSGSVVLYAGVWILTMISMFSIGLVVAGLCRTTKSLNIATSLLYFPMLLFSGATIPAEIFPTGVQAIMKWLPLGIGIDSLKKISADCYNNLAVPLAALAAIATVCTIAAVKTFRWE